MALSNEYMREGPDKLYQWIRQEYGPVVPILLEHEGGNGIPAWLVIGYEELKQVCSHEELFTRDSRHWRELAEGRVPATWRLLPQVAYRDNTRFTDTPYHQPRRDALISALKRIDQTQTRRLIEAYADQLIDSFCALGSAELVAEYARPLPLLVLARLFGLRGNDVGQLLNAVHRMLQGGQQAQRADYEITAILDRLVADRRELPEDDLVSWLIAAVPGLSDEAVRQDIWLMFTSGAGAATGWIANCLAQLATDKELAAGLRSHRLSLEAVLRATLWNAPPAENVMGSFARVDVVLGGRTIRAGDMLIHGLGAANRDPALGEGSARDAHTVSNRAHAAFGAGQHRCPKPAVILGELITTVAVERLRQRCPHMALAHPERPLSWGPSFVVRALTALHVVFTTTPRGARRAPVPSAFGGPSWHSQNPSSPTASPPPSAWSSQTPSTSSGAVTPPGTHGHCRRSGPSSRWHSLVAWLLGR
ncbi:cytochrome P450 [Streptomyces montanus]|uniref:cytochrome P450 n=1 Tax=Streptomyces montanus TaxID=2580423 RepID=UPI0014868075|nr:cytochrome P450 [Streptomyces montanus]